MIRGRYTPLDELLGQAPMRVLRALRYLGWIDVYDFRDLVLNCTHEDKRSKDAISSALGRLAKSGLIEKRRTHGLCWSSGAESHCYDVRITPAGRAYLERKLRPDPRVEFAPARPGTEHFLVEEESACA